MGVSPRAPEPVLAETSSATEQIRAEWDDGVWWPTGDRRLVEVGDERDETIPGPEFQGV
jgi:hypothetical protein